ncbi:MAG: glycosyltransferase family 2 protein [Anaerolineae bacterium]|nr:glycosyltransferase family 2 protein [Anaerolineae bacterium]
MSDSCRAVWDQDGNSLPMTGLFPLYVVVLNWNLPQDTVYCIESVQAARLPGVEILLVDNGSTDNSLEQFQARFGADVAVIETGKNLGFAGGVNVGIAHALAAGAGSVLLLNNDTVVDREMIRCLAAAASSARVGIVGPVIYYFDAPERVWRFADREYRWLPTPLRVPDRVLRSAGSRPFRVDYVTGCGMLVRRPVLEAIGLFDTRYFFYFEDADFCRRARQAGFDIYCAPQAQMWHKVSASARRQRPGARYTEAWGRAQFYRRHPHGPFPICALSYLLFKSVAITLRDVLAGDRRLIPPQWMGFFDGYFDRPSRATRFMGSG